MLCKYVVSFFSWNFNQEERKTMRRRNPNGYGCVIDNGSLPGNKYLCCTSLTKKSAAVSKASTHFTPDNSCLNRSLYDITAR